MEYAHRLDRETGNERGKGKGRETGRVRRRRFLAATALVLGTILLVAGVLWLASEAMRATGPPVDEDGTVAVVFCPACAETFLASIGTEEDVRCALYDFGEEAGAALAAAGAAVLTDDETGAPYGTPVRGSALMHNKFCVIGEDRVMTGSYNPTDGGATNRNDLVLIRSRTLARNYAQAFEDLAAGRRPSAREPVVYLGTGPDGKGAIRVENAFCPRDDCEGLLVATIDGAKEEVVFLTFSFTSDAVGDALLRAQARGVRVEGVCDGGQSRSERQYNECARVGAALWEGRGLLHHKAFVIDGMTVVTGSYNPTASGARRNDENVLVVTDPGFATAYREEYAAIRDAVAEAG
jgi:phosphatidylserine/phosphatidylglycerophosphate/cardiolipin synthase-like enzyme